MNKPFNSLIISFLVLTILVTAGCANSARQASPNAPAMAPSSSFLAQNKSMDSSYYSQESAGGTAGTVITEDRKIVKTGSISMEVADIGKSLDEIAVIAGQFNGYVVTSNQNAESDNPTGHISIRVPSEKFTDAFEKIKGSAVKVSYENTSSQDVTEQYMDLKAQLHNLEATEAQYLELLKKAENVKDMLEVQRELSNVHGDIERIKGRIQYIERTSDMSLIDVTLSKTSPIGESTWDVAGIFKSAVDGLIVFGQILLGLLIWVLVFSPLWIIVLVIIWAVRRKRNKNRLTSAK